jgi:hypothetical protein
MIFKLTDTGILRFLAMEVLAAKCAIFPGMYLPNCEIRNKETDDDKFIFW